MKIFISKISKGLLILVGGFLCLWLFMFAFPKTYCADSYSVTENINRFVEQGESVETIIIGDSRALAGMLPEIIDTENSYNIGSVGSTPIEGYFTLKKLVQSNVKPKFVFLSYAPFHLLTHDSYPRPIAEGLLEFEDLQELYADLDSKQKVFWNTSKRLSFHDSSTLNLWKAYLIKMKFPWMFRAELKNSLFTRYSKNQKTKAEVEANDGALQFGKKDTSDELNEETSYTHFKPKTIFTQYLNKSLELAEKNDIQVIYITAPFNEASFLKLSPIFNSEYDTYFKNLEKEFPQFTYHTQITSYENQFFGDNSHLNIGGRAKFSERCNAIISELKKSEK